MTHHGGLFRSCAILLSLAGCGQCGGSSNGDSGGDDGGDHGDVDSRPFRDEWRVVHEGRFAAYDEDGEPRITKISIGTPDPFGDNFINRGDVIVDFTGEPGRIVIELRRFTFASSQARAEDVYGRLGLWTYDTDVGTPKRPEEMDADADCTSADEPWRDNCAIYVYYEGQSQLERSGADIRVTLPADYRQELAIATIDNLAEDSYPNRGDVCISNLNATATVELASGVAFVSLAREAGPAPGCAPELVEECENHPDGAWSRACACVETMGLVDVVAADPYTADITIDVPDTLWTTIRAENEAGGGGPAVCPIALGDIGTFMPDPTQYDPSQPWRIIGDTNRPSDAAFPGGGYGVHLVSGGCGPVATVETPDEWLPDPDAPPDDDRGALTVCSGCLADKTCDDLLPGA